MDPTAGPLQLFAYELRKLRREAGGLSYRRMAARVPYSATALSMAAGGLSFPSWEVTRAFVAACGGDQPLWYERWVAAEHAVGPASQHQPSPRNLRPADTPLVAGDHVRFVADVTVPDGSMIMTGEKFTKTWEVRNAGVADWENRSLRRFGPCDADGLCRSEPQVQVPFTRPGDPVQLSVVLTAPDYPSTSRSDWKMVDELGRCCFPGMPPLYCIVNVVDSEQPELPMSSRYYIR